MCFISKHRSLRIEQQNGKQHLNSNAETIPMATVVWYPDFDELDYAVNVDKWPNPGESCEQCIILQLLWKEACGALSPLAVQ